MALFFAAGSTCFLVSPFPGYASLVGGTALGSNRGNARAVDSETSLPDGMEFSWRRLPRRGCPG